jgi:uncharacterized protein (DUF427 family)
LIEDKPRLKQQQLPTFYAFLALFNALFRTVALKPHFLGCLNHLNPLAGLRFRTDIGSRSSLARLSTRRRIERPVGAVKGPSNDAPAKPVLEEMSMRAMVDGHVVAASDDVIECKGYQYFPRDAVQLDWLQKAAKTADDRACPHGVQFYDVVVAGKRHARAAWCYEAPRPEMAEVGGRLGFWQDVKVG